MTQFLKSQENISKKHLDLLEDQLQTWYSNFIIKRISINLSNLEENLTHHMHKNKEDPKLEELKYFNIIKID